MTNFEGLTRHLFRVAPLDIRAAEMANRKKPE
jgi:hypothetical protein